MNNIQDIRMKHKQGNGAYLVVHPETNGNLVLVEDKDGNQSNLNKVLDEIREGVSSTTKIQISNNWYECQGEDEGLYSKEINHGMENTDLDYDCFDSNNNVILVHVEILDENKIKLFSIKPFEGILLIRK